MTRTPDLDLGIAEIRAVTAFDVRCAEQVIELFEQERSGDDRPRDALRAAGEFARGAARSQGHRRLAPAAHRAAKDATSLAAVCAAMAAGDAAASVFLHPLADATQVGHILRGPAYAALARENSSQGGLDREAALAWAVDCADETVRQVLRRYPPVEVGRTDVSRVMGELDERLREG